MGKQLNEQVDEWHFRLCIIRHWELVFYILWSFLELAIVPTIIDKFYLVLQTGKTRYDDRRYDTAATSKARWCMKLFQGRCCHRYCCCCWSFSSVRCRTPSFYAEIIRSATCCKEDTELEFGIQNHHPQKGTVWKSSISRNLLYSIAIRRCFINNKF